MVGAGGLGAPVILYLAAAGVGKIGIIDYDVVETSNLQRQVIHNEFRVGVNKADSGKKKTFHSVHLRITHLLLLHLEAKRSVFGINPQCECIAYNLLLDSSNIMSLLPLYDLVVDATDNVATRYLLNDACVLAEKILVSGSALKMEGQLTVYNYRPVDGPCYRCLFPTPPPPDTVTNCSDGGVLGAVTGVIGCLQALEVIKIVVGIGPSFAKKLLLFDATLGAIRSVKIRSRQTGCDVCGDNPTITKLIDYIQFCGAAPTDKSNNLRLLSPSERIDCKTLFKSRLNTNDRQHVLIDCREKIQFDICSLSNSHSKTEERVVMVS